MTDIKKIDEEPVEVPSTDNLAAAQQVAEETATETVAEVNEEKVDNAVEATEEKTEAAAAETEAAAAVKTVQEGKLVMCTNAEFPPYEYHDNNTIVGIDAEICAAIAEKMGLELEIEDIAFDSIIPEISSGKADIGAAGMTVTEDRKQNVDFSETYAKASQVIIVTENSEVKGFDDLKGKKVGVQTGTTGDIYVTGDLGDECVERYAKGMEAVQALSQTKIDAVVIDGEPAKKYISEVPGLKILDESYTDEEYAIAIRKGNTELLDAVNKAIGELKADGTLDAIVAKYINAD